MLMLFVIDTTRYVVTKFRSGVHAHTCLRFLVSLGVFLFLLVTLRPACYIGLLPLLVVDDDVLVKRFFMLAGDGASGMFFVVSLIDLVLLFDFGV